MSDVVQPDECPQGENCPIHFRVDCELFDFNSRYVRLVTYTGDHCVITEDNSDFEEPKIIFQVLAGKLDPRTLPRWETTIFEVGEGSIYDASVDGYDQLMAAIRYQKKHDDWDHLKAEHETTVSALGAGLIEFNSK